MHVAPRAPPAPSLDLAATLATRLCHDIAGLLGTLAGTLELAAEDLEAAALAAETAATLKHRIRLLRAAWGSNEGPLAAADLVDLAQGLPNFERLHLDTACLTRALTAPEARLTLCLLLAAPRLRSGTIRIAATQTGIGISLPLAWPAALAACAASQSAAWSAAADPRDIAAPFACLLAAATAHRLRIDGATVTIEPATPPAGNS